MSCDSILSDVCVLRRSVLENHHLYTAFSVMRKPECDFLKDMNYAQIQQFRHHVIELVLATDFAFHLKIVNQFKVLVSTLPKFGTMTACEDKLLLWRVIMKTADLGHCCKPFELHKRWSCRVMEEMYHQVCPYGVMDVTVILLLCVLVL